MSSGADVLRESVPRATGCDPLGVEVLPCEKAVNVTVSVDCSPPADLSSLKDAELLVFGAEGISKDDQLAEEGCPAPPPLSPGGTPTSDCTLTEVKVIEMSDKMKAFDQSAVGDRTIGEIICRDEFQGKVGSSTYGRLPSLSTSLRDVCVIGFGTPGDLTAPGAAKAGVDLANVVKRLRPKSMVLQLPSFITARQVQSLLESLLIQLTPDNRFKSLKVTACRQNPLRAIRVLGEGQDAEELKRAVSAALKVAKGVWMAQQLVAAPANYVNTITLAQQAAKMAAEHNLEVKILDKSDIERLNMGAYLAVAKGSMYPPKFIHLTYRPADKVVKTKLAFIGKGICFDAGGYNIKNAACQIELMKFDMGGAGAVLGAAHAIAELKPPNVEVHFIVAAAENMVSDKAYRPGDIITASNGKTIEVGNTDAEGRLTLADALVYAEKLDVDGIVDIATLTGACVVALGPKYAGVFGTNDEFVQKVLDSGKASGECMWRMPVVAQYRELLDSKIADINNVGGGGKGGAITAAVFLREFITRTPWAHIDIAGPAWNYKDSSATGYGARTLVELALKHSE